MFLASKYRKIFFSSLLTVLLFLIMAQAVLAITGANNAGAGLDETARRGYGLSSDQLIAESNSDIPTIIGKIVGAGLALLGVVFFLLILYAGLSWILSMGNEEKITQSKDMIIAAVLGLIVVLGAYAITALLSDIFTDAIPR